MNRRKDLASAREIKADASGTTPSLQPLVG
jgi:hypothetical protein